MNITILGAGAWGTALAMVLAERHDVVLWGRDEAAMRDAAAKRENVPYLPGYTLPDRLTVTSDFEAAIAHVMQQSNALLIVASSVAGLRPLASRLKAHGQA